MKTIFYIVFILTLTSCDSYEIEKKVDLESLRNENQALKNLLHEREDIGRYQLVVSALSMQDTLLVDTKTGRIWNKSKFTDLEGEPVVWHEMYKFDNSLPFSVMYPSKTKL